MKSTCYAEGLETIRAQGEAEAEIIFKKGESEAKAMEFVLREPQSHQRVHIQQISHGKLVRISSTSLLLKVGASAPALRTGSQSPRLHALYVLHVYHV